MITESPKRLPEHLDMPCYACEERSATHLCRYKLGDLLVQICLCPLCMQMDTQQILKHTIGLQELGPRAAADYLGQNDSGNHEVRYRNGLIRM